VFRIENRSGKTYAVARNIQIGNTYGNSIEVTSGLDPGEYIVTLGGQLLRNGQEVRVIQ
jgi:multidrug efflux pump subunit AcrA (membrane-fusion protein)